MDCFLSLKVKISLFQVQNTSLKSTGFPDFFLYSYRFWYFIDHNELNHDTPKIDPCPNNQNV